MKATITGTLWHYPMIGMGLVCTYNSKEKTMLLTSIYTGNILRTTFYRIGFSTTEEFEKEVKELHLGFIDDQIDSADLIFLPNPTIVGAAWVDFDLLRN